MTSGRDDARKRRGRGKADTAPADEELGWLAELRTTRTDDDPLESGRDTPGGSGGSGRPPVEPLPRRPAQQTGPGIPTSPVPPAGPALSNSPVIASKSGPVAPPVSNSKPTGRDDRGRDERGRDERGRAERDGRRAERAARRETVGDREAEPVVQPVVQPVSRGRRAAEQGAAGQRGPQASGAVPSDLRAPTTGPVVPFTPPPNAAGGPVPPSLTRPTRQVPPAPPRPAPPVALAQTPPPVPPVRKSPLPQGQGPQGPVAPGAGGSPERVNVRRGGTDGADGRTAPVVDPVRPAAGTWDEDRGHHGTGEFVSDRVLSERAAAALARQKSQVSMLRTATLILIALAIVGAPAAFFVIREFTQDPVFVELDSLSLPSWAAGAHTDGASGSRWCIRECRMRQRTYTSARATDVTNAAYTGALTKVGWTSWKTPDCQQPEGVDGVETCWQRDEYVLELWVRPADCDLKPVRPSIPAKTTTPPSAGPSADPSPGCPGSTVTLKVFDRISFQQADTT